MSSPTFLPTALVRAPSVSDATSNGKLTIGIPASAANSYVVGLLPGSGSGTANATPVYATGTVVLTAPNTFSGGTVLQTGTLLIAVGREVVASTGPYSATVR